MRTYVTQHPTQIYTPTCQARDDDMPRILCQHSLSSHGRWQLIFTLWRADSSQLSCLRTDSLCSAFKRVGDRGSVFHVDWEEPRRRLVGYLLSGIGPSCACNMHHRLVMHCIVKCVLPLGQCLGILETSRSNDKDNEVVVILDAAILLIQFKTGPAKWLDLQCGCEERTYPVVPLLTQE
jgi:hypothetical protein